MKNTEQIKNIIEATSMGRLEKDAVKKCILDLQDVSQQRELLNALADDFNNSTDTYVGQTRIEEVLKAFNCG